MVLVQALDPDVRVADVELLPPRRCGVEPLPLGAVASGEAGVWAPGGLIVFFVCVPAAAKDDPQRGGGQLGRDLQLF